jgi:hypothetical protein
MYEADARVELREAGNTLLNSGHTDQDHSHPAAVEE